MTAYFLCLAGPTASGKTALALQLAEFFDAEIINADSMQVYRDWQILTARPAPEHMKTIPHHLFGHVDAGTRYTVAHWLEETVTCLRACHARGRLGLVVGGTGLYFTALTQGLAPVPDPGEAARHETETLFRHDGPQGLYTMALKLDPLGAGRVAPGDISRLRRLVEVALGTEKPLSAWQAMTQAPFPKTAWQGLVLTPPKEVLHARLEERFDKMMEEGGLEEVRQVMGRHPDPSMPAMKVLGAPPLMEYLRGKLDFDTAREQAKRDTRRYAKRQNTWFRGQMPDWPRLSPLYEHPQDEHPEGEHSKGGPPEGGVQDDIPLHNVPAQGWNLHNLAEVFQPYIRSR